MSKREIIVNGRSYIVEKGNGKEYGRTNDIYSIYARPSTKKVRAFERIRTLCESINGYNLCCFSPNTFSYSAGFNFTINGEKFQALFTAKNTRIYKVN